MQITKFKTTIFLLQLIVQTAFAQDLDVAFHKVESKNGKPIGKITAIAQDPHGYMWFGGQAEKCLYRYDGNRLISYKHDDANTNSLGVGSIETIFADQEGIIWVGFGESGLDRYDPATKTFTHYLHNSSETTSLISNSVNAILGDSKGRLWVGTFDGLDLLDKQTGKFTHFKSDPENPKSISSDKINKIYEDHQGVIWIGTGFPYFNSAPALGGLNRYEEDGTFTQYLHDPKNQNSLLNNKVKSIFEDSRGVFWIGTLHDGLHTMDRKTGRFERHQYDPLQPEKLSRPPIKPDEFNQTNDLVTFINEDGIGNIWIGSLSSGINRYDPITKKITNYEKNNGFQDRSAYSSHTSRDGVIWFSTQEDNLFRVDPVRKKINTHVFKDYRMDQFLEDENDFIWVASGEGGLLQFNKNKDFIRQYRIDSLNTTFLTTTGISSLIQRQQDTLLLGTNNGLWIFNKKTHQFKHVSPDLDSVQILNIFQDSHGLYWFTSIRNDGLIRYNAKTDDIKFYRHDPNDSTSIGSDITIQIMEDHTGIKWVGTMGGGLNRMDPTTHSFKHYLTSSSVVTQLFEDSDSILWVGTQNGLFRYNRPEDKFLFFLDPQSEISNESIYGIAEDNEKNLWLTTPSRIIRLSPDRSEVQILTNKEGVEPNLNPGGIYKTHGGEILVGGYANFYSLNPQQFTTNRLPLNILITDFLVNNLPIHPGNESSLTKPIEETQDIKLKYDQNNFAFHFTAIDYRAPETIQYYTMLENYDNEWRLAQGEKSVHYFFVAPGEYIFRVRALGSDGTKSEKEIHIHITPPWWQTWWAYSAYGILFMGVVWTTYRYQQQRIIRSEQEKAQQKEIAQAKEIEKAYTELKSTQAQLIQSEKMASLGELTAGIAHEIQNPLNFVNNFSEVSNELLDEMKAELEKGDTAGANAIAADVKQNLEKILHHGKRADAIVKGMLQHSRASSGQKELTDINALCDEYLRLAYHGLRAKDKSFNAKFETDFDLSLPKINLVQQDIGRVILNLINNAFYAVNERLRQAQPDFQYEPTVKISTKVFDDKVEIRIIDNGNGIPQKVIDKIFQPFFTTKPTGQGTGLGLSLSYDIVKAHGGELKVSSTEHVGSTFLVTLPC